MEDQIKVPQEAKEVLLGQEEVAHRLGVQAATLATWRFRGFGPPFVKVGRSVRYRLSSLEAWLETRLVDSTSAFKRGA